LKLVAHCSESGIFQHSFGKAKANELPRKISDNPNPTTLTSFQNDIMTSTDVTVKLTGSENWKAWNERFIAKAESKNLWTRIDPDNALKGSFMEEPLEPDVGDFEKRLDAPATNTRRATATSSASSSATAATNETAETLTQSVVRADPDGRPAHVGEMTPAGKEAYDYATKTFNSRWPRYVEQRKNVSAMVEWLQKTVSANLYDTCCKSGQRLDEWYAALKTRAGTSDRENKTHATELYEAAIKPLSRKPKDMLAWLSSWEAALLQAQEAKVFGTNGSQDWWLHFSKAIRAAGYETWSQIYYISNQETIDSDKLDVRKLCNDFGEFIRREEGPTKRSTIAKGAFPTYADQTEDEEPEGHAHKKKPVHRKRGRSRSRSPDHYRSNKRRNTVDTLSRCPACGLPHPLQRCWAARPETCPAGRVLPGWKSSSTARRPRSRTRRRIPSATRRVRPEFISSKDTD
jgi:hypothetical protein